MRYGTWLALSSDNGLLPGGTKPLPEPMLTCHQWCIVANHFGAILQELFAILIYKIILKITHLKLHLHLPGANGLIIHSSSANSSACNMAAWRKHLPKCLHGDGSRLHNHDLQQHAWNATTLDCRLPGARICKENINFGML